jgi:hypothetical protein
MGRKKRNNKDSHRTAWGNKIEILQKEELN